MTLASIEKGFVLEVSWPSKNRFQWSSQALKNQGSFCSSPQVNKSSFWTSPNFHPKKTPLPPLKHAGAPGPQRGWRSEQPRRTIGSTWTQHGWGVIFGDAHATHANSVTRMESWTAPWSQNFGSGWFRMVFFFGWIFHPRKLKNSVTAFCGETRWTECQFSRGGSPKMIFGDSLPKINYPRISDHVAKIMTKSCQHQN